MKYLLEYTEDWPVAFTQIQAHLLVYLPAGCRVHHVGSTAIPGMPAKDIVDVNVEVPVGAIGQVIEHLEVAGYRHVGDRGIPGREAFEPLSWSRADALCKHHLYACEASARELRRHLAFRNYLIAHPERAAWLAARKRLHDAGAPTRDAYIEAKSPDYEAILAEALGTGGPG